MRDPFAASSLGVHKSSPSALLLGFIVMQSSAKGSARASTATATARAPVRMWGLD
jgi:hypothetical protein